jgi:hypothetical protein
MEGSQKMNRRSVTKTRMSRQANLIQITWSSSPNRDYIDVRLIAVSACSNPILPPLLISNSCQQRFALYANHDENLVGLVFVVLT